MKRITYVSRFASSLSQEDVDALTTKAEGRNKSLGITGVLIITGGFFFQIIEGHDEVIDELYARIEDDSRHCDIIRLATETDISTPAFPSWSMKMFDLDQGQTHRVRPFRRIVHVLTDTFTIMQRYVPAPVMTLLRQGINPSTVVPHHANRVILFADMVASSQFASFLTVDSLVRVINTYLTTCTGIVTACGGEVNKFVGDCVMAVFPFENVDGALTAAIEILKTLENLRQGAPSKSPLRTLHTGVGIAAGEVVEGNIGTEHRLDHTVLGRPVHRACALEAASHGSPHALLTDDTVHNLTTRSWPWLSAGSVNLKGCPAGTMAWTLDLPAVIRARTGPSLEDLVSHHLSSITTHET